MSKSTSLQHWEEESQTPLVCDSCLGNNPFLRMTKEPLGRDCKVCLKPYTFFRWSCGTAQRHRNTIICTTCARLKFVCQSCIQCREYGIPVEVRDFILGIKIKIPKQNANREYFLASQKDLLQRTGGALIDYRLALQEAPESSKNLLKRLSKEKDQKIIEQGGEDRMLSPDTKETDDVVDLKNVKEQCSFFAKGKCNRGSSCPYRHVLTAPIRGFGRSGGIKKLSLKDYEAIYYGENDPDAKWMMKEAMLELKKDTKVAKAVNDVNDSVNEKVVI